MQTQVKDIMKQNPIIIAEDTTLQEAAQKMKAADCGVLPIGTWDALQGIITDRDIVVRAIADGVDASEAQVCDYMTEDVYYCDKEDTLTEVAAKMREYDVSRLVVQDEDGMACGVITFGCILRNHTDPQDIVEVVESAIGKKAA